jgi:GT2 family glycosyltransferase
LDTEPAHYRIAALLTCFNRREKTLRCLRDLQAQSLPPQHAIEIFLVDDGSRDGTGEGVREAFPQAHVIQGTGSLFWSRGMHLAWTQASKVDPDYYLLLNDDTFLFPGALIELLQATGGPENNIICVGSIVDPVTGEKVYGAQHTQVRPSFDTNGARQHCDTFNANCVLVPRQVYNLVGTLDPCYSHGLSDPDYGYRAFQKGTDIRESRKPLGQCAPNPITGTWQDDTLPVLKRLQLSQLRTGLPWRDWLTYTRRHLGWKWPAYFVSPYLKIFLKR